MDIKRECMPEISRMVTLSTFHITKETSNMLEEISNDKFRRLEVPVVAYKKGDYGFLVYTGMPEEPSEEDWIPKDLKNCMDYARKYECEFLVLDGDGPVMDNLQSYEELW